MRIATPIKVVPNGLPRFRSRSEVSVIRMIGGPLLSYTGDRKEETPWGVSSKPSAVCVVVLLKRKSCVTAIPMDAKANEVRSHARNVRSRDVSACIHLDRSLLERLELQHTKRKMISRDTALIL